ncbi:MAG: 2-oxoacid:ferredoxin oxidoreductase subunit beta [Candidatus Rokubacteria bacterium]|nr:2-oxoacid:ferredoxin oxidoreductase subunit beta [Candidatus Rokubacteria bacterium]
MATFIAERHPSDPVFRADRLPHIWCPGCGIGPAMHAYAQAMLESGIPLDRHICVSGIGCTGRVPGYLNMDSYHTTHGRAIPFATAIALVKPELEVTVFSGDGDLFAIGGNHFIHAARRNVDLNVICINNFNYGMTGGQVGPTTPMGARATTAPYGNYEQPFNLPYLAASTGAVFVARWTSLHLRQLKQAFLRAMAKRGFTFIEVLAPCPVGFGRPNDIGDAMEEMTLYRERCVVDHGAPLATLDIDLREKDRPIVLGNFVDIERPVFDPLAMLRPAPESANNTALARKEQEA